MILLLSFDVRRRGGIERLTLQVKQTLESAGHSVVLLTPKKLGPGWWGRQLGRLSFLLQLIPALCRSQMVLSMHVLLLQPVNWLNWCRRSDQTLHCWVHGIEVWGSNCTSHQEALKRCHSLIASSHFTKEQLAPLGCDIKVVHPMADLFDPTTPPQPFPATLTLLTVARMCRSEMYKGHGLIVDALHQLQRQNELPTGFQWEVVGEGDQRPELMQRVQELGMQKWVCFLGSLSDQQLRSAFQRSSAFLMPSPFVVDSQGHASGEGFGIVYLEAAMAGRASIACNEGGQTDLIQDGKTGWLIPPNISALMTVLRTLIDQPGLAAIRGTQARDHALAHFSIQRFKKQLQEALRL